MNVFEQVICTPRLCINKAEFIGVIHILNDERCVAQNLVKFSLHRNRITVCINSYFTRGSREQGKSATMTNYFLDYFLAPVSISGKMIL